MIKKIISTGLTLMLAGYCFAQQSVNGYKSLDTSNPITFGGDHIVYKGITIKLGPNAFFIDGQLTDEQAAKYQYVYNSVNKAAEHLSDGSEESPMVLYIAPWVYWIDNPDDPAIRLPKNGLSPYALVIDCEWLRFYGLSNNAGNVVLACNRGQSQGSQGNFTMFRITGQGTSSENITFGNYCNIDLVFPLKPEFNREKRSPAIVQAQLISCNGDKIVARNTRFVSRLNLMPFVGGKRVLFDRCHFESTDDALCGTGVYLNSTFEFYGGKPWGGTSGTGAVLLNCDMTSFTHGNQYFVKMGGQMAVVDSRISTKTATYLGWKDFPQKEMRSYQYNVTWNGSPVTISKDNPSATVDMTDKKVLDAYRFVYNNKVVYNIYNLLCGDDDWDPMGIKNTVLAAEKNNSTKYTFIPVQLLISPTGVDIETNRNNVELKAKVNRFGNYELKGEPVKWDVAPEYKPFVELNASHDGAICTVIPKNNEDDAKQVIITASTASGLQAASVINVYPSKLPAPSFISAPIIKNDKKGKMSLIYKLDTKYEDQSVITWYRCTDNKGSNPIEVAVSRLNQPLTDYVLSDGDVGYYLMASVAPKHKRCDEGEPVKTVTRKSISLKDIKADNNVLITDFKNIPTRNQPEVIPGFWTMTYYDTPFPVGQNPARRDRDAWYYGEGSDGSANKIGLLEALDAKMLYTPVGKGFADMKLSLKVTPFKYEGQGFSMANKFMDILFKMDTKTMTGYGLRLIRTTKYHDAIDCIIVKYDNNKVTEISKPVSTSCFRPTCNIKIEVSGGQITVQMDSPAQYHIVPDRPEVLTEVKMKVEAAGNEYGGFGILYSGGATTMIDELKAEWK